MKFSFNLAEQKLHMKYAFDKVTYKYQWPLPSSFTQEDFSLPPGGIHVKQVTFGAEPFLTPRQ